MLFFGVDRFAEFLIFQNYKVFFFFDPVYDPSYTLYVPQSGHLSSSPGHASPLIGVFTRQNPSQPMNSKYPYIGPYPPYGLIKRG